MLLSTLKVRLQRIPPPALDFGAANAADCLEGFKDVFAIQGNSLEGLKDFFELCMTISRGFMEARYKVDDSLEGFKYFWEQVSTTSKVSRFFCNSGQPFREF